MLPSKSRGLFVFTAIPTLFIFASSPLVADEPAPSAEQLERVALDYRRHTFDRGYVHLHRLREERDKQKNLVLESVSEHRLLFDGDAIRYGRNGRHPKGTEWGQIDWVILSQGKYIEDARRDLAIRVDLQSEYENIREHFQAFHPRALGMSLNSISSLVEDDLGRLLNRTDRRATAVARDEVEGVATWRIDYELTKPLGELEGWAAAVWIAPGQGNGLIKAEERFKLGPTRHRFEVRSKLKQYPQRGVWYPSETEVSQIDDGEVYSRERVTVKEAEFNIPIDPDEFTLKGLDLAVGRKIIDSSEGPARGLDWDGEKAVGISAEEVRRQEEIRNRVYPEPPPLSWSRILKYGGATLLAVAAIGFGWYGLRRRAAT